MRSRSRRPTDPRGQLSFTLTVPFTLPGATVTVNAWSPSTRRTRAPPNSEEDRWGVTDRTVTPAVVQGIGRDLALGRRAGGGDHEDLAAELAGELPGQVDGLRPLRTLAPVCIIFIEPVMPTCAVPAKVPSGGATS